MDAAFYGDHPALDLINTVQRIDGALFDTWHADADVLQWLVAAGVVAGATTAPAGLLDAARALRETVRTVVADRKDGRRLDLRALNAALGHGRRHLELVEEADGALAVAARYAADTPQQLLAPLAERVAELLATADFALVRKCENPDCVLWFLDRTKSHRRRWCSMAVCGNRHKVASFRQRRAGEA